MSGNDYLKEVKASEKAMKKAKQDLINLNAPHKLLHYGQVFICNGPKFGDKDPTDKIFNPEYVAEALANAEKGNIDLLDGDMFKNILRLVEEVINSKPKNSLR